jgi:ABC-type Fe3+/spermidine/putrescine transport system ATPase subunit
MKNQLELVNLEKPYGETIAVRGIDLSLSENTYCCLLGPSGCGMTNIWNKLQPNHKVILIDPVAAAEKLGPALV